MPPRTPDPRSLGQLLVMQGCVQLMDSDERLYAMVRRGLGRVPGIAGVDGRLERAPDDDPPPGPRVELPIETLQEKFGHLSLAIDDPAEFVVYEPFVRNLAGTMALWLESQGRRRRL